MCDQVLICLVEERESFIYTIRRAGLTIEREEVRVEEPVAPGYYGGSEAVD